MSAGETYVQKNRFEATGRNDELVQRFFRNASTDEMESLLEEDKNRFETEHGGAYNLGSAVLEVYDDQQSWRIVGSPPSVEEHLKELRKEISCWGSEDYDQRYEAGEEVPEISPLLMTDGGRRLPDPSDQEFYEQLGSDGYVGEDSLPVTDGGQRMEEVDHGSENYGVQESFERNGAPATWDPESKSEVGGFDASSDEKGPGL